jgi:hypothetical protein
MTSSLNATPRCPYHVIIALLLRCLMSVCLSMLVFRNIIPVQSEVLFL